MAIYQVRLERGVTPWDIIYSLTHAVWKTITAPVEMRTLDPLRWSDLYLSLRKVFEKRLVCFDECGHQPWCGKSPARVFWSTHDITAAPPVVYLLEVHGGVERFVGGLCALTWRCMMRNGQRPGVAPALWRKKVSVAVEQTLEDYLFFSEKCSPCPVRKDARAWTTW